jgi:hypothetical protein
LQALSDMPEVNSWLQPLNQAKDVAFSIARWIPPTTAGMADDADLAFAPVGISG